MFRGPYLNDVTTDAITVLWESPQPTTGIVHYGVNSTTEQTAVSSTPSKHHEVRLTGLSGLANPGSAFVYELEVDGTRYPGRFYTAVQGDAPFTFLIYGDNRSSEPQHQAVVDAILAEMIDARFIVSTGDMVSSGDNEGHWDTFFAIEAPFLRQVPVYIAIGNHEVDRGNWDIGERVFAHPTTLAPASNNEAFFHFVYGNTQFIIINVETDNLYNGALSVLAGDQEDWLERVLTTPPANIRHRFVFIHQGPYSSKSGRSGNFWMRQWLDTFKANGVNVIVSGHDHYAERGWAKNGLPYVIHGGGGAPLYDTKGARVVSDHTIEYSESRLGYVIVNIDGPKATLTLKGLNGVQVDQISWGDTQNPQCMSSTDCTGRPQYACPGGAWECYYNACNWACDAGMSSLITCLTDSACEDALRATCTNGTPVCERPSLNPLEWYCRCDLPPECTGNADCTGRPPPVAGCVGTWACQDEVCEFSPVTICDEPDAGPPDTGTSADATTVDATSSMDGSTDVDAAPFSDATSPAADAASVSPQPSDSGVSAAADAGMTTPLPVADDESCSCAATNRTAPSVAIIGMLLMACLMAVRKRR